MVDRENTTTENRIATCSYCGDGYTPQGIRNHERWCDENPHPGVSPEKQADLGLDTDESADLPPRDVLTTN